MDFSRFNFQFSVCSRNLLGDLHTPVSLYLKLRDLHPASALLESSDYQAADKSRSYLAFCPLASLSHKQGECLMKFPSVSKGAAGQTLRSALAGGSSEEPDTLMQDFLSCFHTMAGCNKEGCGFFGYTCKKEGEAPERLYILYKYVVIFDHYKNELLLKELLLEGEESRLPEIEALIRNRNFASYNFETEGPGGAVGPVREQPFLGDDFKVYRAMRSTNPSPYLFYFDFGGFHLFGSSPASQNRPTPPATAYDRVGFVGLDGRRNQAYASLFFLSRSGRLRYPESLQAAVDLAARLHNS
ncbi:MAG: hypothetical protein LBL81_01520 [Tannerella sp.]|nr:hypothetical protein [Tannerella sp.]